MFTIMDHRLMRDDVEVTIAETDKMGSTLKAQFLVIHYTAGASFAADVTTLSTASVKASVHLVIGRQGELTQIVPFNRIAWHAGVSEWSTLSGMNKYSIGIELSNAGRLTKTADGQFHSWWGAAIPAAEVMEAVHERGGPMAGWHLYTEAQISVLFEIAQALHQKYQFLELLGHDDISWDRKSDPGPAFPMRALRSRILGRN